MKRLFTLVVIKLVHNLLAMQLLHCRLLTVTPLECELYLGFKEAVVKASGLSEHGASPRSRLEFSGAGAFQRRPHSAKRVQVDDPPKPQNPKP